VTDRNDLNSLPIKPTEFHPEDMVQALAFGLALGKEIAKPVTGSFCDDSGFEEPLSGLEQALKAAKRIVQSNVQASNLKPRDVLPSVKPLASPLASSGTRKLYNLRETSEMLDAESFLLRYWHVEFQVPRIPTRSGFRRFLLYSEKDQELRLCLVELMLHSAPPNL
jgi:hypothetical protein